MERCPWCLTDPILLAYHDEEWGFPVRDDRKHFEFLLLETMQAGLSWLTILRKRDDYRKAFDGFDWEAIALYDESRVSALMEDAGIIRNRRKIEGAVKNARAFMEVREEFGAFNDYIWGFTRGKRVVNSWHEQAEIPVTSDLSDEVARDMKKRGFSFIGSVTVYSHLQAIGIIDDHLVSCFRHRPERSSRTQA